MIDKVSLFLLNSAKSASVNFANTISVAALSSGDGSFVNNLESAEKELEKLNVLAKKVPSDKKEKARNFCNNVAEAYSNILLAYYNLGMRDAPSENAEDPVTLKQAAKNVADALTAARAAANDAYASEIDPKYGRSAIDEAVRYLEKVKKELY